MVFRRAPSSIVSSGSIRDPDGWLRSKSAWCLATICCNGPCSLKSNGGKPVQCPGYPASGSCRFSAENTATCSLAVWTFGDSNCSDNCFAQRAQRPRQYGAISALDGISSCVGVSQVSTLMGQVDKHCKATFAWCLG